MSEDVRIVYWGLLTWGGSSKGWQHVVMSRVKFCRDYPDGDISKSIARFLP